jgi:general secretion pathway protein L
VTGSGSFIRPFFVWWRDELVALVPARLRGLFRPRRNVLLAEMRDRRLALKHLRGGQTRDLGEIDLAAGDAAMRRQAVQRLLRPVRKKAGVVALDLPAAAMLSRHLTLPEAAEENLRQVALYEMERLTPFAPNEIYFDLGVVGRDPDAGRIEVKLDVVPRKFVDEALADIDALGLHPQQVGVAAEGLSAADGTDFLHSAAVSRGSRAGTAIAVFLGVLTLCLLVLAVLLPLERKQAFFGRLTDEVAILRKKTMAAERLAAEIESVRQQDRLILERKLHGRTVIAVLNAITELLPDDTWLSQMIIRGNKVEIQGYAPAAPALIRVIEDSPAFRNVSMTAQVRRDTRTDRDLFNITFDIVPDGA